MRQHVNPLSSNFNQIERIPSLSEMFDDSKSNLHLDIGCAAGEFLFDLALVNTSWNYLGIEIDLREGRRGAEEGGGAGEGEQREAVEEW